MATGVKPKQGPVRVFIHASVCGSWGPLCGTGGFGAALGKTVRLPAMRMQPGGGRGKIRHEVENDVGCFLPLESLPWLRAWCIGEDSACPKTERAEASRKVGHLNDALRSHHDLPRS